MWPFLLTGEPNDILVPRGKACQDISALLGQLAPGRELSFGGVAYVLPVLPGITVKDVGTLSLPVREEMAQKLVPKGLYQGQETWMFPSHQVKIQNPDWKVGIETLCTLSAEKLGYKDVALQSVLSRVMLCEPGGYVETHQELRVERCVATLEIQLPSEYTGGALVVHNEDGDSNCRYEFDRVNSAAAFRPHYVVHATGAFCALEKVTSGYRLVMLYSLCLPSHMCSGKTRNKDMQMDLAKAIGKLPGGSDEKAVNSDEKDGEEMGIPTLLLSKSVTKAQIQIFGWEALFDVDRGRFELLNGANSLLSPEKQLKFYFAHFRSVLKSDEKKTVEVSWYSSSGKMMSSVGCAFSTTKFNLLNPDNKSLEQMSSNGESDDNRDHGCCVVVMWSTSADITNILTLMGFAAAVTTILAQDSINTTILRKLLYDDGLGYYHFIRDLHGSQQSAQLVVLCQKLATSIVDSGDATLSVAFFKKYFDQLDENEKTKFIPWLAALVRGLGWNGVGALVIRAIDGQSVESSMNRALTMTETLSDCLAAHTALTRCAVNKAQLLAQSNPSVLASASSIKLLWKHSHALESLDPKIAQSIADIFLEMDGRLLGPVVDAISKCIHFSPSQYTRFGSIVLKRRQWLINEFAACSKPFTWQIINSNFPYVSEIVTFLQGPKASFEIRDFKTSSEARFLVAQLHQCIKAPITITVEGQGLQAFVKMLKIGGEFDLRRKEASKYMTEIERLGYLVMPDENTNNAIATRVVSKIGAKRTRVDEPEVVEID